MREEGLENDRVIADERLQNQRLTRTGPRAPGSVVAWFGAVQAQEYGPAKWALGLRMPPGTTDATIERAVDRGRILRTHVLRPTWHFVAPADIRWMLELTGPQVQRRMAPYDRQYGLEPRMMTRAAAVFERALGDAGCLTRAELGAHLARRRLPNSGPRLAHLVMYAEAEGLICSGPRRGKQSTYALLAQRAPRARRLSRDEALGTLAKRFFQSHGPATTRDFVWWSGLKTADAKRGIDVARAKPREVNGLKYWSVGRAPAGRVNRDLVHLLPIYDEYLGAYRDRAAVPRAHMAAFANFWHAVVIGGHVAGTWRTRVTRQGVDVQATLLRQLEPDEQQGLAKATARYGRFLEVPVALRT